MSYEVFGDNDDPAAETFVEMGWWPTEKVDEVVAAIQALRREPIYQNGDMKQGISVRFLQRMTLLDAAAGIEVDPALLAEAEAGVARPPGGTP